MTIDCGASWLELEIEPRSQIAHNKLGESMMQPREIARRTFDFEYPERMCMNMWGGVNDFGSLPMREPEGWVPPAPGVDGWGCTWVKTAVDNMGQVRGHPLADLSLMDEHQWPDPEDPSRFRDFATALDDPQLQERFIGAGFGFGIFERTWMLHGFQATLEDYLLRPHEMLELVDRVVDIHVRACRAIHKHSGGRVDNYGIGDDLGHQGGPFFSKRIWRKFYYPAYDKLISVARKLGMKVLLHSDGYMPEILDDLCDLGLGWVNIQQPLMWGIDFLAERFKGRITFNVFPDMQCIMTKGDPEHVMPRMDPNAIRAHVRELVEKLDSPRGGFAPGVHAPSIGHGVTEEATLVAVETFQELAHLHHG